MPARTAPAATTAGQDEPETLAEVLAQATFVTMGVLSKVAADNELSLTQLRVLAILRDRDVTMSRLAGYLGVDKSSMTGLVDRAEKRGLLARNTSALDRRSVEVALTPAGREFAAELQARIVSSLAPFTDVLPPAERSRLQSLLGRMIRPGAGP